MAPRIKHAYVVTERREVREHIASHDTFPVDTSHTLASWVQQGALARARAKKKAWAANEAVLSLTPTTSLPTTTTTTKPVFTNTTTAAAAAAAATPTIFPRPVSFPYRRACKLEPYMPPDEDEDEDQKPRKPATPGGGKKEKSEGGKGQKEDITSTQQREQQLEDEEDEEDADAADDVSDADSTGSVWLSRPFVTLTWTQSLDSQIAVSPARARDEDGAPAPAPALPGPSTPRAVTHFLRSRHDAVLVGVGTAAADDPGLDCRLEVEMGGGHQPRPVILDPFARWDITPDSTVIRLAREGLGQPPWILHIAPLTPDPRHVAVVEAVGGRYLPLALTPFGSGGGQEDNNNNNTDHGRRSQRARREKGGGGGGGGGTRYMLEWASVLTLLRGEGVRSLLVEGGGRVINDLLALANRGVHVVDSLLVAIAPVFFGDGGVSVCPTRPYVMDETMRIVPGPRLADVVWTQMGEDMLMCGRVMR